MLTWDGRRVALTVVAAMALAGSVLWIMLGWPLSFGRWIFLAVLAGASVAALVRLIWPAESGKTAIAAGAGATGLIAALLALNNVEQGEQLTGEQKAKAYRISTKLYEKNKVELTLDERTFLKERVEKLLPALHAGRIVDVLEEREIPPILSDGDDEPDDKPDTAAKQGSS